MFQAPTSDSSRNQRQAASMSPQPGMERLFPTVAGKESVRAARGTQAASSSIALQRRPGLARLHRTYGNQAVLRMVNQSFSSSGGRLQRKCACGGSGASECAECKEKHGSELQRAAMQPAAPNVAPPIVHDVLHSAGRPLDNAVRGFMEPRFGADFGDVRVHTDSRAAESARAVDALAYTVGRDIVFASGGYSPQTQAGQKILAHELTHTIQQGMGVQRISGDLTITDPADAAEREARSTADAVMEGTGIAASLRTNPVIARDKPDAGTPAKKKITVNPTILQGSSQSVANALTYANTKVYNQADVEVVTDKQVTLDEPKSKAILGADLILEEYTDVTKPTDEEKALFKVNQVGGEVTVYFVKGQSAGNTGESFLPSSGVGFVGSVYSNAGNDATFSHELAHVLLDSASHTVPDDTYLMYASKKEGKYKLTPEQITKIKASPFVK